MRAPLYADPGGTDPLYDDPSGSNPLESDTDYLGTGTLTSSATFSSTGAHGGTGVGNLHYVFYLFTSSGSKSAGGVGLLATSASMGATGVASSSAPPIVYPPIRRWPIYRPQAAPFRMGHGVMELEARMWAVGYKSFESDDELVLALAA